GRATPRGAPSCSRRRSAKPDSEHRRDAVKPAPCVALHELGQSVWLDNINDGLIQSGELARLIAEGSVYGVTSNPTIFKNAIAGDQFTYPTEIARLANMGKSPAEIFDELAFRDISRKADPLADTFRRRSGRGRVVRPEGAPAPPGRPSP